MKTSSLVWVLLVPLMISQLGVHFVNPAGINMEQLLIFLANHSNNGTEFTYSQLKQWYEGLIPKDVFFEKYPRLFPFCVNYKQIINKDRTGHNAKIKKYEEVFKDLDARMERFYDFNETIHSTYKNTSWVEEIFLTRINTPELDMVNLRQWLHIEVKMTRKVQGLYMQSIVGPMGLPFGEFNLDFPCADDAASSTMQEVGELADCAYRPRSSIVHPSAYVGYDNVSVGGREEWHAHFLWTDITCMETPYVQFLILAVENFEVPPVYDENYKAMFSPVYLNTDFDSKSGAPFPYYPEWVNDMYCFFKDEAEFEAVYKAKYPGYPSQKAGADAKFQENRWKINTETFRIQPSESYDNCLMADKHKDRDDQRLECPPGPFQCTNSYSSTTTNKTVAKQRLELVENENKLANCSPCILPACGKVGILSCNATHRTTTEVFHQSDRVESAERHGRIKTHGIMALLAILVLMPISNFMGRFYKEVCGGCMCNNGPWIFIHIILHILSIVFIWLALGPVTTEGRDILEQCKQRFVDIEEVRQCFREESFANPHIIVGTISVGVQHLVMACSFFRSSNNKVRNIQVALHSHFGYLSWILGGVAALLAFGADCFDVFLINLILFLLPLLFFAIGFVLDLVTDKKIGIIPRRKQWPTLEPVHLEGRGPLTLVKWVVFGIYCFIQMIFWILAFVSSTQTTAEIESALIHLNEDENSTKVERVNTTKTLTITIQSLFGSCNVEIDEGSLGKQANSSTVVHSTSEG